MNWVMIPIIIVYVAVIYQIRQKIRNKILMNMVRKNILNSKKPFNPDLIIQGYNLVFAFILLPILFLSWSMLFYSTPYTYNWLYSVVAYTVTITAL